MWILEASKKTTYWHTTKHTYTHTRNQIEDTKIWHKWFSWIWFLVSNMVLNEMWVSSTIREKKNKMSNHLHIFQKKQLVSIWCKRVKKKSKSFVTVTTIFTSLQSIPYLVTMISKHQICALKKSCTNFSPWNHIYTRA